MKTLKNILKGIEFRILSGSLDISVNQIQFDSRKVVDGDVFVAVSGTHVDGHQFIDKAITQGAVAVIAEKEFQTDSSVTEIVVPHSGAILGLVAANFYDRPSEKMKVVAVTGTNGKTTIATVLFNLFQKLGYHSGLFSTIKNCIGSKDYPATHTTPDPVQIQKLMAEMVAQGCTHCFMEASSHAIDQDRVAGIDFDGAIFTNLTHDHLDYHKTFDAYLKAKKKLFDHLPAKAFALSNGDEKHGSVMLQNTLAKKLFYALKSLADFNGKVLEKHLDGMLLEFDQTEVWTHFSGVFNAYNLLAVYGAALSLGQSKEEVLTAISELHPVSGRFEIIRSLDGKYAIVDYAHTPDALTNVLTGIHDIRTGDAKIITVVGAGGDRDKTKRPEMALEAVRLSDRVVLTSDNPRSEDPEAIIHDMEAGVPVDESDKVLSIAGRKDAIKTAVMLAKPGDIILIAGKGHEDYQEVKGVKHHFDDREVVKEIFHLNK